MANFSREQVEAQIRDQLVSNGFSVEVARSAAVHGANHYLAYPNATIASSLAVAKTYAKPLKRVKGKPDRPHVPGRRMGHR
ncbi:cell envelope biogenesis protein OmpA [Serratia fonticola]|uniref:cell envelope biogenesis protein OmpA n=1 Tax=Serratia fonticola TaxID=47917 RepID=UPI003AAAE373|nr:cell envelope biogenesis protein OmpA [Serratia fonticola]HBE9088487.1 cell envelope biogenesis protein OmpA [Serratia fonticola]